MWANDIAILRPWHSADIASMTVFDDCARVDLYWADGGHVSELHDAESDARAQLARLGFSPT